MAIELIVHVGNGKTGTTSIQQTLAKGGDALAAQGARYLGFALENCSARKKLPWQTHGTFQELLLHADLHTAHVQLYRQLQAELEALAAQGITRAIWSNEALFQQSAATVHALKRLQNEGITVRIIGYVRRHDQWARSAYAQWGIKHKIYPGPVKTFAEWVEARSLALARAVNVWESHFGPAFELRNFDAIPDVTVDFLEFCGLQGVPAIRAYETPGTDVLAAWALYNSRQPDPQSPAAFERIVRHAGITDPDSPKLPEIPALMPSEEQLDGLLATYREDIDEINALLVAKGQPPFTTAPRKRKPAETTPWEMDQILLKMVFSLQEQVFQLRKTVTRLTEDAKK